MSLSPLDYLRHILDEVEYLTTQVNSTDLDQFLFDDTAQRAFSRSIEIIGEATKKVPSDLKQHYPDVEWRAMAAMRDKIIHHYFGVDYDIVWDVAKNKAPVLKSQIENILKLESNK